MDACYQRRPDGRVVCRFSNGQEDLAREFLARGPVSPPIRRAVWPGALAFGGSVFGVFLVAAPFTMWISDDYSWTMVRICLGLGASFGVFASMLLLFIAVGTFVEPERELIEHRTTHSFASLGLPRRTRYTTPGSNGGSTASPPVPALTRSSRSRARTKVRSRSGAGVHCRSMSSRMR